MKDRVLKKVNNEDSDPFLLKSIFKEGCLFITILQNCSAFTSSVKQDELKNFAKSHELNVDNFYNKLKEYIIETPEKIKLNLIGNSFTVQKIDEITINFFKTELETTDYTKTVESLLFKFYNENVSKGESLAQLEKQCSELREIRNSCELKLEELLQKKQQEQEELFGQFVLIVNEKKRQIQHLSELLEAFKRGRPTENPPIVAKATNKKRKNKQNNKNEAPQVKLTISRSPSPSSSDSETENYNTDEEAVETKEVDEAQPSTSKLFLNFLSDDEDDLGCKLPKRVKTEGNVPLLLPNTSTKITPKKEVEEKQNSSYEHDTLSINIDTQELLNEL